MGMKVHPVARAQCSKEVTGLQKAWGQGRLEDIHCVCQWHRASLLSDLRKSRSYWGHDRGPAERPYLSSSDTQNFRKDNFWASQPVFSESLPTESFSHVVHCCPSQHVPYYIAVGFCWASVQIKGRKISVSSWQSCDLPLRNYQLYLIRLSWQSESGKSRV